MTINVNNIVIDRYKTYVSNSFLVPINSQSQYFDVTTSPDIFLVIDNGYVIGERHYPQGNFRAYVKIVPTFQTKAGRYTIRLTDDKQNVIDIIGDITIQQTVTLPTITVTSNNASISDTIVNATMEQDNATNMKIYLSAPSITWTGGLVTQYEIQSTNHIECSSDIAIARSALAITCDLVSSDTIGLYVDIANPSVTKSNDAPYGFSRENSFNVSFSREAIIQGVSYVLFFTVKVIFKQSQIYIQDRRCQTAIIDPYHQKIIIAYDFIANAEIAERQVAVGFDKTFSVPTKFSCFIPEATHIPGISGRQNMPITVIAQSVTKSPTHYTMKIVLLPTLFTTRKLITQRTELPLIMMVRGQKHYFNIPVVING